MGMPQPPFNSPVQTEPTIFGVVKIKAVWQNWLQLVQRYLNGLINSGPTDGRPTQDLWVGQPYFDTTLNVQVVWNGSAWVVPAGGGTVTAVTGTAPIASSGGATPNISITQASGASSGFLSSTDWTAFNSKVSSVSGVLPISSSGGATPSISMTQASSTSDGWLSSADWNAFNAGSGGAIQPSYSGVALSGTYSRPASDMFGDIRSVFDFAPTSAQTDDTYDWTSAIQAAHDSLYGDGGLIYFPPLKGNTIARYKIASTVNITKSNVVVDGFNAVLYRTSDGVFFNATNEFCTIRNFTLYGAKEGVNPVSSSVYAIVAGADTREFYLDNVDIRFVGSGVSVASIYFRLKDVSINDYQPSTGVGYLIDTRGTSPDTTGWLDGCECDNDAGAGGLAGILVKSGNTLQITNCEIQHNIVGLYYLPPASVTNINSCFFVNNYFDSNTYAGIRFSGQYSPTCAFQQFQFTNCWMTSNAGAGGSPSGVIIDAGISINQFSFVNCNISGNVNGFTVENNASGSNKIRSLIIDSCMFEGNSNTDLSIGTFNENFIINGCYFEGGGPNSLYINGGCNNYVITNNTIARLTDLGGSNRVVTSNIVNAGSRQNGLGYPTPVTVTGSRSLGTTYTNNKPVPIFVCVTALNGTPGATDYLLAQVNGVVVQGPGGVNVGVCVSFPVPPSGTYRVYNLYGYLSTVSAWVEYDS